MARVYLTRSPHIPIAYTVEQRVGPGCPNRRDDVLLVQFFLRVISENPATPEYKLAGNPLSIDGACGNQTIGYIQNYQAQNTAKNPGAPVVQDGVIDPPRGGQAVGSFSHMLYTILALNFSYKNFRGVQALADITNDGLFPADLLPSIKIV